MKTIRYTTTITLIVLATLSAQTEEPIQLLTTGQFHKHEFKAEAGDGWWGIFPEERGFTLQPAPVTVTIEYDAVMDVEGEKTGRGVTVPQNSKPVFLIKGLPNPTEGPLASAELPDNLHFLYPGQQLNLSLVKGKQVENRSLIAMGSVRAHTVWGAIYFHDYHFLLVAGRQPDYTTQELGHIKPFVLDGVPKLIWAGDVDRDGELDLLLDVTWHYNLSHYALYLSSAAKEGELVAKVAELIRTGC